MNPIQEFMTKARLVGEARRVEELEAKLRVAEAARLKAESEAEELRAAMADMQLLKERYQMALIDIVEVLTKYGMVI